MKMLRFLFLSLLIFAPMIQAAEPLTPYRWENRLVLASVEKPEQKTQLRELLEANQSGFVDRDMALIDLSPKALEIPNAVRLSSEEIEKLRERFEISDGVTYILIGKDGGEKARQTGELDLKTWFDLIDTMPMRQREMRQD